jgi:hypothetical protein
VTKASWAELGQAACIIENRLPCSVNEDGLSPYELVYKSVPNLSFLRAIGCRAYVHTGTGRPLDPRGEVGILVGYSANASKYRILFNNSTGHVIETSDVTFAERTFDKLGVVNSAGGSGGGLSRSRILLLVLRLIWTLCRRLLIANLLHRVFPFIQLSRPCHLQHFR